MEKVIQYRTSGTCCQMIQVKTDGNVILDVDFLGGCNGNLSGIKNLVCGMPIDEVISKLSGIKCGSKPTSCPDQLARCLSEIKVNS
jgi:uncharacterized protein (TIGR03905 family)